MKFMFSLGIITLASTAYGVLTLLMPVMNRSISVRLSAEER